MQSKDITEHLHTALPDDILSVKHRLKAIFSIFSQPWSKTWLRRSSPTRSPFDDVVELLIGSSLCNITRWCHGNKLLHWNINPNCETLRLGSSHAAQWSSLSTPVRKKKYFHSRASNKYHAFFVLLSSHSNAFLFLHRNTKGSHWHFSASTWL